MSLIQLLALKFLFISSTLYATPLPEHGSDSTSVATDYPTTHELDDYTRESPTSGLLKAVETLVQCYTLNRGLILRVPMTQIPLNQS
jgi:hypothetical protein